MGNTTSTTTTAPINTLQETETSIEKTILDEASPINTSSDPQKTLPPVDPEIIISDQDNIISILQRKLSAMQNSVEPFSNINPVTLDSTSYPKLKDYASIYNENIALLDDPNNDIKNSFNAYITLQDNKIKKLRTELNDLQTKIQRNKLNSPPIQAFKSIANSQIINLEPYNNNNKNNSTEYPNYLIYGNNGCLQYEKSTTDNNNVLQPATWSFKPCNSNEPKQQFIQNQVNFLNNYNYYIKDPANKNYILNDGSNTTFGFYIINPITSPNDQCLQLNNDGISVMSCNLTNSQRFKPYYSTVIN
jgi:hypothetical protein